MMKRSLLLVAVAVALAGCGGATAVEDTPSDVAEFGDVVPFSKNSTVSVGAPHPFERDKSYVVGREDFPEYVKFVVTVVNGSPVQMQTSEISVVSVYGALPSERVFQDDLLGPPKSALSPGESMSWPVGFGVVDSDDVQLAVTVPVLFGEPSGSTTVIFTS